jgi:transcriptional regulator with XRE-family HTH domain
LVFVQPRSANRGPVRATDPDRLMRDLGRRLAELREERALTQEALAEEAGFSTKYLQRLEAGRENLSLRSLVRLANLLKAPVVRLLDPPRVRRVRKGRPPKARE